MSDLLERLRDFVRVYDHTCPALTANIHPVICRCGRCQRDFMERAADEIARLEKALAWYADENNWNEIEWEEDGADYNKETVSAIPAEQDRGERARKALERSK